MWTWYRGVANSIRTVRGSSNVIRGQSDDRHSFGLTLPRSCSCLDEWAPYDFYTRHTVFYANNNNRNQSGSYHLVSFWNPFPPSSLRLMTEWKHFDLFLLSFISFFFFIIFFIRCPLFLWHMKKQNLILWRDRLETHKTINLLMLGAVFFIIIMVFLLLNKVVCYDVRCGIITNDFYVEGYLIGLNITVN